MKTSTMLLVGGAAVALYYISRQRAAAGAATSGQATGTVTSALTASQSIAAGEPNPAMPADVIVDADYFVSPGWGVSWGSYRGRGGDGWRGHVHHGSHGGGKGRR